MSQIKNGSLGLYGAERSKCNDMTKLGFKELIFRDMCDIYICRLLLLISFLKLSSIIYGEQRCLKVVCK